MNSKTLLLGEEKLTRLLPRMAIPTIAAQLINIVYNIVDRIYIGQLVNATALTAVGITLPLIILVTACALLVAGGGAPNAAICMGKKCDDEASRIIGNCITAIVIMAGIVTALLLIFNERLLYLIGATEDTIEYAKEYMTIYASGSVFVMLTVGLSYFITAQGNSLQSMIVVLAGAVTNVVLDPIFINVFGLGVRGAAFATVLSQALSTVLALVFLFSRRTSLKLKLNDFIPRAKVVFPAMALGLSPFVMQATEAMIFLCFNIQLKRFGGSVALGTMTILSAVMLLNSLPIAGLVQGAQPILSYNFGARNNDRVKKAFLMVFALSVGYSFLLWLAVRLFPNFFSSLFINPSDPLAEQIHTLCSTALRIYMGASILLGAQSACQQTFVSIGRIKISVCLAVLRKIILLLPLVFLLPLLFNESAEMQTLAVFWAEPVADIVAVFTTLTVFALTFNKILRNNTLTDNAVKETELLTEVDEIKKSQ